MASLPIALQFLNTTFAKQDGASLIQVFLADPTKDDFQALQKNLQSMTFDKITSIVEADRALSNDPRVNELAASAVREFLRYVREYDTPISVERGGQDSIPARRRRDYKTFDTVTQRVADMYKSQAGDWLSVPIQRLCATLMGLAQEIDAASGGGITYISDAAARLLKILLVTVQPLNATRPTDTTRSPALRASTAVSIANLLFRTYHGVNSMHLFTSVVQPLWGLPQFLDMISKAEAVEYRYWIGRYKLTAGNVQHPGITPKYTVRSPHDTHKACTEASPRSIILIYLVIASLCSGYCPDAAILTRFDLNRPFEPIIKCLTEADGAGLKRHLETWMVWFAKHDLLIIMKEKMDVLIWRSICRKVAMNTDRAAFLGERPDFKVTLASIASGLRLSYGDPSYDLDDAEAIVMCLIDQGYIRGGIVHSTNSINRFRMQPPSSMGRTRAITTNFNALSLSPTKNSISYSNTNSAVDCSNPFIDRKASPERKPAPRQRLNSTNSFHGANMEHMKREGQRGVISGGIETKKLFDVVKHDYIVPVKGENSKTSPKKNRPGRSASVGRKLSSSTSSDDRDRMIPVSANHNILNTQHIQSSSPGHTARLAENLGIDVNQRILRFHQQGPQPTSDPTLALQRQLARPLYQRPGGVATSNGATTNKTRVIPTSAQRVLDAPGLIDDFYLNLLAWSCANHLAVALCDSTYIWNAESGTVDLLGNAPEGSYVSAVDFTTDGTFLGVANGNGVVEVWDMETSTKLRSMAGHQAQVASLSWNQHILSSGCADGSIWLHDVRVAQHKVMELIGHEGEVCGLEWRADGELLASGGNDNVLNVWDGRTGSSGEGWNGRPKFTKNNHTAAVKAIAWCPWQNNLLATGGGTGDAQVHFWSTTTGARMNTFQTPTQISSVQFSPHSREFLTTHGAPCNSLMLHAYPSMSKVAEITDAHDARVLGSAVSPGGDTVCTYAGDENVKFWKVWELPKKKKETKGGDRNGTGTSLMMIR
ncbi:ubiquitin-protein transferase activating protein [Tulasnella sp. 330]|nr:ubiquitin-protein transferase activating protein [Tulasnella sp. 330]KAG8882215.1 ubiquitin-protein transferase activating protein [Tulasnella sp. 331]